jgi:multicomponent Na+:H+ antiporter subunit D
MNAVRPHLPILLVLVPLFGALLAAFARRGNSGFAIALAVSWLVPFCAGAMLWQVLVSGPISYHLGSWAPPWGIEYRVDVLNAFVLMLVSVVGAAIMPFARRSVAFEVEEGQRAWFYCMYLLCLTGLLGIAVTGDAFNAFVFLEISSLSTYVLIALGRDRRALLAAFQYLIMGTIGATFYVIGVGLLYLTTGTLNMVDIAARLGPAWADHSRAIVAALAFVTVGVSLKLALFPLHVWLPNAYAYAPSWATAFLSATATKVAIYLLVRFIFSIFGVAIDLRSLPVAAILVGLSLAAMIAASLIAIFQSNLSRLLAYSSVAQIGYITLGIGIVNLAGLTGGLVHIVNHAMMKAALFLAVGAIFFRAVPCSCPIWRASAARCRSPWRCSRWRVSVWLARPARPGSFPNGISRSGPSKRAGGSSSSSSWQVPCSQWSMSAACWKSPGCVSRPPRSRTPAIRRSPCCCRWCCWPRQPSISVSTRNGPPESQTRLPRACWRGCDDPAPFVRKHAAVRPAHTVPRRGDASAVSQLAEPA